MDIFFIFRKNTHNIRNFQIISNENKKAGTVRYSQETIKFRTPSQKKKKKKLYGPFLWMGFNCLKARATSRRQFTFYH